MDHRTLVKSLPAELREQLTKRSDRAGLFHLARHILLIVFLMLVVLFGGWVGWIALLPLGIAMVFLFTLEHEATHKTPFETPWMNEVAGHVCGFLLLLPFNWFRYFHLAHHKHTNDPDKDPELLAGAKPDTWRAYLLHVSGISVLTGSIRQIIRNATGTRFFDYVPETARSKVIRESRIYLGFYALAFVSLYFSSILLWLWIVPILVGQPFLRLYLLAEHGRCALVSNMLENTRTTYTNRVVRFLAWNMPYHSEHHCFPNVPFHQLPALNRQISGDLKVTADGYSDFSMEYVSSLDFGSKRAH